MKYFTIIQALCRTSLANPNSAIQHQITRLRDALQKDGFEKESNSLTQLLSGAANSMDMAPSRIERSFIKNKKEKITSKTPKPVDKETSTPLAEIYFPDELPKESPIFNADIKYSVRSIIDEWSRFEELSSIDAQPASSCLIFGEPGTGKTHLAKWISSQMGLPVVLARLEGLMSSFLGTTSRNIGNLFKFANRYNCVLLLDEFDAIAKLRNDPQEVGEVKRVVNTLLQCLDERREDGFTFGVTNHVVLLDPAIWRRFDIQIEIPKPTLDVLKVLLNKFLSPLDFSETEIKFLAWCMEGSSGADVRSLCNWLKRVYIIDGKVNLISSMKRFVLLNSGRVVSSKKSLILNSSEELISILAEENQNDFKQKELAKIFGISPSTLSKNLAKYRDLQKS